MTNFEAATPAAWESLCPELGQAVPVSNQQVSCVELLQRSVTPELGRKYEEALEKVIQQRREAIEGLEHDYRAVKGNLLQKNGGLNKWKTASIICHAIILTLGGFLGLFEMRNTVETVIIVVPRPVSVPIFSAFFPDTQAHCDAGPRRALGRFSG